MKSAYYINLNGRYGRGAYALPDYNTLADLLSAMDRLGIGQTVAYHSNACDLHPVYGNRMLLEDIRTTPQAVERVIPALVANPSMLVGQGEMEHLISCLENRQACCIVLFPQTNRYRLPEITRVLDRVKGYRPVILVDIRELDRTVGLEDLVVVAARFPEMRFIVKEVMWWQFSGVFEAMNRVPNLFLDTSWLHMRDGIKIICEHLGPDRVIFGAGPKAHAGASIASLSYADLPQSQKDAIASDNFIALIADPETRQKIAGQRRTVECRIRNGFWEDFINGHGVRNTLVIDAHTHIGPFARSWMLPDNTIDGQIQALERDMRRFGIQQIVSSPETALFGEPIEGNRAVENAVRGKEARFRGYLVFNPFYWRDYTTEMIDSFFARGYFTGFKLLPEYLSVDIADPRYVPAMEYADRHALPILIHTWEGVHGTAQQTADVASKYPNASFIFGHTGGGSQGRRQCEAVASDPRYDNCLFEFCGSFTSEIEWTDTLQRIDYRRVLFGTDTIVHDIAWEMGRLLSLDIPDDRLRAILGGNMRRILDRIRL